MKFDLDDVVQKTNDSNGNTYKVVDISNGCYLLESVMFFGPESLCDWVTYYAHGHQIWFSEGEDYLLSKVY
ncbi:hypothetical protein Aci022_158 [Acinetobacter phage vB_AbaM_B09_Aci02-2]|uniref:Uncharacterized protein n=1 Tax=Acinetobacter phage vB_AbaM_B09_Aci02-2 TaxID=2315467 RepID=A0A386KN12_9CAUD|nr:hypothetical protein HOU30_gp032 [Acinetobacter phage vB_AbaM_B09_Aci02-2]AYD85821.1 hypothetical protein Aci022_158 [Acinetobacter phage vB_AbaM_B09_Aci02-2]